MTTLIAFLFALGVLVFVHELGHYLVARWCGVKILRFSIGFGKPLLTWKVGKDQTEWSLSPIPLGGYVRMLDEEEGGEIDPAEVHRAFNRLPLLKRSAVVIAGPAANFLLAIVLYAVLGMAGLQEPAPVLATPPAGTAAASAGIQEGERVLTVDGHAVQSFSEMRLKMIDPIVERRPIVLEVEGPDGRHHRSIPTSGLPAGELERDFTRTLGVDLKAGVVQVASVEEGSAAARAGLQPSSSSSRCRRRMTRSRCSCWCAVATARSPCRSRRSSSTSRTPGTLAHRRCARGASVPVWCSSSRW